jgi:hypothetical protein
LERLVALSLGLGAAGLAIVELTTTVIPPDPRGTAVFSTGIGILAVIHEFARKTPSGSPFSGAFNGIGQIRG